MVRFKSWTLGCAVTALAVSGVIWGCSGGGAIVDTGGNDGTSSSSQAISFNTDPDDPLVANATTSEGDEVAVYGEKDSEGDATTVTQVDLVVGDNDETVTLQLDDQERVVYAETDSGTEATFSYDEDTDSVRTEVTTDSGETSVDEAVNVVETAAARYVPAQGRGTSGGLCVSLRNTLSVMDEFFDCAEGDTECEASFASTADALREFCEGEFEEVSELDISLDDSPRDVPLGIKPFFTIRPAGDDSATVILTAVVFGGVAPHDVSWEQFSGSEAILDNLPGGTAVADLTETGTYVFRTSVTDSDGNSASSDIEVEAGNQPKFFVQFDPAFPEAGQVVTFTIVEEIGPLELDPEFEFFWQFGDGEMNSGESVTHAYGSDGDFVVKVLGTSPSGRRGTGAAVVPVGGEEDCPTLCFENAEIKYLNCLTSGNDPEDCEEEGISAFKDCVIDECGLDFECEDICENIGERVFESCLDDGASTEECAEEVFFLIHDCRVNLCGDGEEPDCEQLCGASFDLCQSLGGSTEDCELAFADCVEFNCGGGGEFECGDDCKHKSKRIFEECTQFGGSEEECGARARRFAEDCFKKTCGEEAGCENLCDEEAARIIDNCLNEGTPEEECFRRADFFFFDCIDQHCQDNVGDCEETCHREAFKAREDCLSSGGDNRSCGHASDKTFFDCVERECDDQSQGSDCEKDCFDLAEEQFGDCLGTGDRRCHAEAEQFIDDCLRESCGDGGHGGGGCEDECARAADEAVNECLAVAEIPEECNDLFDALFNECINTECDDQNPPGGGDDCENRCEENAALLEQACFDDGGDPETCLIVFEAAFDDCVLAECDDPDPPTGGNECESLCEENAAIEEQICFDNGGAPEDCLVIFETTFDDCIVAECGDGSNSGGTDCEANCEDRAAAEKDQCLSSGNSIEECDDVFAATLDACITTECSSQTP